MTDHEPAAGAWDLRSLLSTQPASSADPPAAEPPPQPVAPPDHDQAPATDTTTPITPAEPAFSTPPADAGSAPAWIRDAAAAPAPNGFVDQSDQPVYPTAPNRRVLLVGGAVAAVLLVAVGGVTAATMAALDERLGLPPAAGPLPPDAGFTEFPATTSTGDTPSPDSTPTEPDTEPSPDSTTGPEAEALEQLEQLRQQDALTMVFDGRFAAQLASKSVGIVDPLQTTAAGSHTFTAADILAEHLALRSAPSQGTSVVLVLSTDFGKRQLYQGSPLWVTFALGDFPDREAVQRWCARRFPELAGERLTNQCTVRKLEAHP